MKNLLYIVLILACVLSITLFFPAFTQPAHASAGPHSSIQTHPTSISPKTCYIKDVASAPYYYDYLGIAIVHLMYNTCSRVNYASVDVGAGMSGTAYIQREPGPDGGWYELSSYCSFNSNGTCNSPAVYSPNNLAQACWNENGYDNLDCTGYY